MYHILHLSVVFACCQLHFALFSIVNVLYCIGGCGIVMWLYSLKRCTASTVADGLLHIFITLHPSMHDVAMSMLIVEYYEYCI